MSKGEETKWIQIAAANLDVISGELLEWSGFSDLWNKREFGDRYDFLFDVAEFCQHIHIEREELGDDSPIHSWCLCTIETDNPELLRLEIRIRLEDLSKTS